MTRFRYLPAVFAALVVAGCGSSTSAAPKPTTTTTTVEQAVLGASAIYDSAFFKGDADAVYAMWSQRCQTGTSLDTVRKGLTLAPAYSTAKNLSRSASVSGDAALLTVHYDMAALDKIDQHWTREGGTWKWDGC